ncbi:hypothetical protein CTEN210_02847 [Chaetoceros tenuissimus]|uniref:RING-type E3 ubiquitin transferase n=1 Tax=Chaetoceros tenuissimus TaxID=426638 RepID=A0AAD3CIA1_9STRA|nr:hypothetical protein CTEN210_02847 [Chaetoceros tenuissimus]
MNNNTSSSDRDETSTSQEENDGQEIPGSGSIQKLKDIDIKSKQESLYKVGKSYLSIKGGRGLFHHASERENIDKEVIKYLVSVGGPKLTDAKNIWGKKAESKWSTELKEYIDLGTKTLPELCDDLKCPICFDIMSNVHVITKCCHRFCKSCITQSFEKRGNKCPVCKTKVSFHTGIRKDPLLGKITMLAKEKDDRNVSLQLELSEAMQREHVLKQQNRALVAELLNLKRKHEEM